MSIRSEIQNLQEVFSKMRPFGAIKTIDKFRYIHETGGKVPEIVYRRELGENIGRRLSEFLPVKERYDPATKFHEYQMLAHYITDEQLQDIIQALERMARWEAAMFTVSAKKERENELRG